ncbi:hypothetical protein GF327_06745 [Candidatus Woesearchaeota archaeon]|nr:hypothetical protein [Candidatus Woesearchaeota archaeon]
MMMKKSHLLLFLIVLLGFLLRLNFFINEKFIGTDPVFYSKLGENLIEKGRYRYGENFNYGITKSPGFPVMIGLVNIFVKDLFLSGKLISLISSTLMIPVFFLLGKEIFNFKSGLFAATAFSVYPFVIKTGGQPLSESIFFLLVFSAFYFFILFDKRKKIFFFSVYCLFLSISYLFRPEGLILAILPIFLNFSWKKKGIYILALGMIFLIIASPYLIFIYKSIGKISISGKSGINIVLGEIVTGSDPEKLQFGLNPEKNQLEFFVRNQKVSFLSYVLANPFLFLKRVLLNFSTQSGFLFGLLLPVIIPFTLSFLNRDLFKNTYASVCLVFVFVPVMFYSLFYTEVRFLYLPLLFAILFSSDGFISSGYLLTNIFRYYEVNNNIFIEIVIGHIRKIMLFLLILSTAFYLMNQEIFFDFEQVPHEHIEVGQFIKNISGTRKVNVMSRKPWASFYSDSDYTDLPYAAPEDVVNFAYMYDVDFIVIDERLLSDWDFFDELFFLNKKDSSIELIHFDSEKPQLKLFQVNKDE